MSEASKVYTELLSGPTMIDIEVPCPQKPNDDAQTLFFGSVPRRRRKGQWPRKGTIQLRMVLEASKVHTELLGGPALSDIEVPCPQK